MQRLFLLVTCLLFFPGAAWAQKGHAEPDYYPLAYSGDTWTGEVTAFDNDLRTLTLTYVHDKKLTSFIATIPDAPYEWAHDARGLRVVDFPFDKEAKGQTFKYVGVPGLSYVPPGGSIPGIQQRPNPPASNVMGEFSQFVGRQITVYYTTRERVVGSNKEKYYDVWRIRIYPAKKQ